MSNLGDPLISIKDAQTPERISWEDCVLLLQVGGCFLEIALLQEDTGYFSRLLRFETAGPEAQLVEQIKNILSTQDIQPGRCKKTVMIIDSPRYLPVPEKINVAEGLGAFHTFLFTENPEEVLRTDTGIAAQWHLQYAVNKVLLEEARSYFKNLQMVHLQTALLKSRPEVEGGGLEVYLTCRPGQLSMAAFLNGQLQILQSFKAETVTDVLYAVLNFVDTRKLSRTARVFLTGDFPGEDLIRERLQAELGDARWLALPEQGQYPSALNNYSGHCFYHLVSLGLCE